MKKIFLHFDTTTSQANIWAPDLKTFLCRDYINTKAYENKNIKIIKSNNNTQDAGTILKIILSASSIVTLAKGIALWLQKKPEASLTITVDKDKKEIIGTGLKTKDIENILKKANTIAK